MLNAAFNSIVGFDDDSDTPNTEKDVLKHKEKQDGGTHGKGSFMLWKPRVFG
jgi:hypothetical protein